MSIETTFEGDPVFSLDLQGLVVETEMQQAIPGRPGMTPYEEWLSRGHTGSYEAFLAAIGGAGGSAFISEDDNNRLTRGTDGGLKVPDEYTTDLLALYILNARG